MALSRLPQKCQHLYDSVQTSRRVLSSRDLLDELEQKVDSLLASSVRPTGVAVLALTVIPPLAGISGPRSIIVSVLASGLVICMAMLEDRATRMQYVALFTWSYLVRIIALFALRLADSGAGALVSTDGLNFLATSTAIARAGFSLNDHPARVLGTFEVAHYYLFAVLAYGLKADLFSLQLMNTVLGAGVSPLVFSWSRAALPRGGVLVASAVAVHPALVLFSARDLLKDSSVLFFSLLAVWAVTKLRGSATPQKVAAFGSLAAFAVTYVRLARFYVLVYLELAVFCATVLRWCQAGHGRLRLRSVVLVLVFLIPELGLIAAGWPIAWRELAEHVPYVFSEPRLRDYTPGLGSELAEHVPYVLGEPRLHNYAPGLTGLPDLVRDMLWAVTNVVRKLFGPFVWILPSKWTLDEMVSRDFLLYPGMLLWYAVLPFVALGLIEVARRGAAADERDWALMVAWIMVVLYLGQYLVMNLSYRHRDGMLPFLLTFAVIGMTASVRASWWGRLYSAYTCVVVVIAVAHLAARAMWR